MLGQHLSLFLVLHRPLWQIWVALWGTAAVAARFFTTACFVTKVTKRAAMPAYFVTNEVVTNHAGIAPFFHLTISTCDIVCVTCVCVCMCECACTHVHACVKESQRETERMCETE